MVMNQKVKEAVEKVGSCLAGRELFRVSCLKDESGEVKVSVDDRKKIWKEQMKS